MPAAANKPRKPAPAPVPAPTVPTAEELTAALGGPSHVCARLEALHAERAAALALPVMVGEGSPLIRRARRHFADARTLRQRIREVAAEVAAAEVDEDSHVRRRRKARAKVTTAVEDLTRAARTVGGKAARVLGAKLSRLVDVLPRDDEGIADLGPIFTSGSPTIHEILEEIRAGAAKLQASVDLLDAQDDEGRPLHKSILHRGRTRTTEERARFTEDLRAWGRLTPEEVDALRLHDVDARRLRLVGVPRRVRVSDDETKHMSEAEAATLVWVGLDRADEPGDDGEGEECDRAGHFQRRERRTTTAEELRAVGVPEELIAELRPFEEKEIAALFLDDENKNWRDDPRGARFAAVVARKGETAALRVAASRGSCTNARGEFTQIGRALMRAETPVDAVRDHTLDLLVALLIR